MLGGGKPLCLVRTKAAPLLVVVEGKRTTSSAQSLRATSMPTHPPIEKAAACITAAFHLASWVLRSLLALCTSAWLKRRPSWAVLPESRSNDRLRCDLACCLSRPSVSEADGSSVAAVARVAGDVGVPGIEPCPALGGCGLTGSSWEQPGALSARALSEVCGGSGSIHSVCSEAEA
eukprot:scaffold18449_cov27-Tisochrysis_lutea.AAC.3